MKNGSWTRWLFASLLILGLVGCAGSGQKTGAYVDDSWITTKVKSDLLATKGVSSTHIGVTTTNGVVTLSGTAPTAQESEKATQVASGVSGVKSVQNEMRVQ